MIVLNLSCKRIVHYRHVSSLKTAWLHPLILNILGWVENLFFLRNRYLFRNWHFCHLFLNVFEHLIILAAHEIVAVRFQTSRMHLRTIISRFPECLDIFLVNYILLHVQIRHPFYAGNHNICEFLGLVLEVWKLVVSVIASFKV